jgi:hypothetical protein
MQIKERTTGAERLYERELPGGGYVAIESSTRGTGEWAVPLHWIRVERRGAGPRRWGHEAPVIMETADDGTSTAFTDLLRVATDNAALARALMSWQAARASRAIAR